MNPRLVLLSLGFLGLPLAMRAAEVYRWNFTEGTMDAINGVEAVLGNPGGLGQEGYSFTENEIGEGITITQPVGTAVVGNYTIVLDFTLDNADSYQRLIDFKDKDLDEGFYTRYESVIFYDATFGRSVTDFQPGQRLLVVLRRDAATKTVSAVANGKFLWSFVDSADDAVFSEPDNLMRFFEDDGSEHPTGTVRRIRVFNHVLASEQTLVPKLAALNAALKKAKKIKDKKKRKLKVRKVSRDIAGVRAELARLAAL